MPIQWKSKPAFIASKKRNLLSQQPVNLKQVQRKEKNTWKLDMPPKHGAYVEEPVIYRGHLFSDGEVNW